MQIKKFLIIILIVLCNVLFCDVVFAKNIVATCQYENKLDNVKLINDFDLIFEVYDDGTLNKLWEAGKQYKAFGTNNTIITIVNTPESFSKEFMEQFKANGSKCPGSITWKYDMNYVEIYGYSLDNPPYYNILNKISEKYNDTNGNQTVNSDTRKTTCSWTINYSAKNNNEVADITDMLVEVWNTNSGKKMFSITYDGKTTNPTEILSGNSANSVHVALGKTARSAEISFDSVENVKKFFNQNAAMINNNEIVCPTNIYLNYAGLDSYYISTDNDEKYSTSFIPGSNNGSSFLDTYNYLQTLANSIGNCKSDCDSNKLELYNSVINFRKRCQKEISDLDQKCTLDNSISVASDCTDNCCICTILDKNIVSWAEAGYFGNRIVTGDIGTDCDAVLGSLGVWLTRIYKILLVAVPVIIVAFGFKDFIRALTSGKEDELKKAGSTFIKRLVFGAVFVALPIIVKVILTLALGGDLANICIL